MGRVSGSCYSIIRSSGRSDTGTEGLKIYFSLAKGYLVYYRLRMSEELKVFMPK